ncbi:protein kinase domain-containing protein [Nannocystis pusilla]|uniref:protein kinase domain-containing protein n=1 Tax=Nannocystis pusilla TaxID=889268 RepID=UPI003B7FB281
MSDDTRHRHRRSRRLHQFQRQAHERQHGRGRRRRADGRHAAQVLRARLLGDLLGHRYLLEKRIGGGQVSTFYRAKDRRMGVAVGVKVLHPEYNKDPELLRRFTQEARLASQVRHPNLVPAFDFGRLDGKRYIVFELVEARTLQDLIVEEALLGPRHRDRLRPAGGPRCSARGRHRPPRHLAGELSRGDGPRSARG